MPSDRPLFSPSSSPLPSRVLRVLAPAKLNLHLRVGPLSADGFHPLLTWMCTAGLFDTLTFVRGARSSDADRAAPPADATPECFSLSTDHPTLPTDRRNLVVKVATALADTLSRVGEGATDVPAMASRGTR